MPDEMSISHMALSRDGSLLVFVSPEENSAMPMLYLQRIGSSSVTLLPGTQGASYPFWSPDDAYVGFFANGKLQKIAIAGGTPQVLATALAGRGGSWGSKGVIIYTPDAEGSIQRINADGSGMVAVTQGIRTKEDETHRWPMFLPDGDHFLFLAAKFGNLKDDQSSGIYFSSLEGKERKLAALCRSSFGYDAHNLFYADDQRQLVSVAFDSSTGTVSGSPTVLANAHRCAEWDVDLQHRRRCGGAVRAYLDGSVRQRTGPHRRSRDHGESHAFSRRRPRSGRYQRPEGE
jgi:hypothetical protein